MSDSYLRTNINSNRRWLEWILVATVIFIIVGFAFRYYTKVIDDIQQTNTRLQISRVQSYLTILHAHWLVQGKPKEVMMESIRYVMNDLGWPVSASGEGLSTDACEAIWQAFHPTKTGSPSGGLHYPVAAQTLTSRPLACQFSFRYQYKSPFVVNYFANEGFLRH